MFTFDNLRSTHMADVRRRFVSGRTFLGKNKVAQVALGRSAPEAHAEQTNLVAEQLTGQCGMLFTDEDEAEVVRYFRRPPTRAAAGPEDYNIYTLSLNAP